MTETTKKRGELTVVPFHGDELLATKDGDGVWVSVRRVCESLGVTLPAQSKKLQERAWSRIALKATRDTRGRVQEALCIHLDSLPMWLATIEPSRVGEDVRPKLERYQVEAAKALAQHFLRRDIETRTATRVEQLLMLTPVERGKMYEAETWRAFESLYVGARDAQNLKRPRRSFRNFVHMLRRCFLGDEVCKELRKLNPTPTDSRDYAFFQGPIWEGFQARHLAILTAFAQSATRRHPRDGEARRRSFWADVFAYTGHRPQLGEPDPSDPRQLELFDFDGATPPSSKPAA